MLVLKTIRWLPIALYLKDCPQLRTQTACCQAACPSFCKRFFFPSHQLHVKKWRGKTIPVVFLSHKEKGLLGLPEVDRSIYSLHAPWQPEVINCPGRTLHLESSCDPIVRTWKQRWSLQRFCDTHQVIPPLKTPCPGLKAGREHVDLDFSLGNSNNNRLQTSPRQGYIYTLRNLCLLTLSTFVFSVHFF